MKRYEVVVTGESAGGFVEVFNLILDAESESEAGHKAEFITDGGTIVSIRANKSA